MSESNPLSAAMKAVTSSLGDAIEHPNLNQGALLDGMSRVLSDVSATLSGAIEASAETSTVVEGLRVASEGPDDTADGGDAIEAELDEGAAVPAQPDSEES